MFNVEDGVLKMLIVPQTYPDGVTAWKPPCGTNDEYAGDDPEHTLEREVRGESGLVILSAIPLGKARKYFAADPDKNRGAHAKNWYLVIEWDGELRTKRKMDGPDWLEVPVWVPVAELYGRVPGERRIIRSHREALDIAVQMFLSIYGSDKSVFEAVEMAVPPSVMAA